MLRGLSTKVVMSYSTAITSYVLTFDTKAQPKFSDSTPTYHHPASGVTVINDLTPPMKYEYSTPAVVEGAAIFSTLAQLIDPNM